MKNINTKFENLVRGLNYSKIRIIDINVDSVRRWCEREMPKVVEQLEPLHWDLSRDDTWLETVFVSVVMKWYDRHVTLFLTNSMVDFNLALQVFSTKKFSKFRDNFNIHAQTAVLVNPVIFLEEEDLDSIYLNLDFDRGFSGIDFSYYDDNDDLEESVIGDWDWLVQEDEWHNFQIQQAYN